MTFLGIPVAFGIRAEWLTSLIVDLPPGTLNVRRRFRAGRYATVFVKTATAISQHYLVIAGEALKLSDPIAVNSISA